MISSLISTSPIESAAPVAELVTNTTDTYIQNKLVAKPGQTIGAVVPSPAGVRFKINKIKKKERTIEQEKDSPAQIRLPTPQHPQKKINQKNK